MSSPRPGTVGDFEGPPWFQAGFYAALEGFLLSGVTGSVGACSSSLLGVWVAQKSGNHTLGALSGAAACAGLMAGFSAMGAGTHGVATAAITGCLLGGFSTYRGHSKARVRDTAGNATMLAAVMFHGPGKVAAGLGAAAAVKLGGSKAKQAVVAGAVSAAIGATLSAVGFTHMGLLTAAAVTGISGALGPSFGPRFSQFFRNVSGETGKYVAQGLQKTGLIKKPLPRKYTNAVGAMPSSFVKEGVRGCMLADLTPWAFVVGGVAETIAQIDIFLHAKEGNPPAASSAPGAPTAQTAIQ